MSEIEFFAAYIQLVERQKLNKQSKDLALFIMDDQFIEPNSRNHVWRFKEFKGGRFFKQPRSSYKLGTKTSRSFSNSF